MRVLFRVEGGIDQAVFPTLVARILGEPVEATIYEKRVGGWTEVFRTLTQSVWKAWESGCVGAVVAVDADSTTPHDEHGETAPGECRYCKILTEVRKRPLPSRPPERDLKIAVAVPVEALEAWLLQFGHLVGSRPTGPAQALDRGAAKRLLWGSTDPSASRIETTCRTILDSIGPAEIDTLTQAQPSFALFRASVESWRS